MRVGEATSRLRNTLKEFKGDTRLTDRYLWNIIWSIGALLLNREKNLNSLDIFKTVDLETEEVNLLESSCVPLDCIGCRVKIPSKVESKYGLIYKFIATPDLSTSFKLVNPTSFTTKSKLRGKIGNYAYMDNGYIYMDECFPCIKISYLPNDSEEALEDTEGNKNCSMLEKEISLPNYIMSVIFQMSLQELSMYVKLPFDTNQNKDQQS